VIAREARPRTERLLVRLSSTGEPELLVLHRVTLAVYVREVIWRGARQ
jgi:hypothetical protein